MPGGYAYSMRKVLDFLGSGLLPTFFYVEAKTRHLMLMNTEEFRGRIAELLAPILKAQNMELVEVEFGKSGKRWLLRLFVDKPGGVTLDDCAQLSGIVGDLIEVHDLIDHAYTLEVSSPGLNRSLKKPADYQRYIGRLVRLVGRGQAKQRTVWRGELLGLENDSVKIREGDTVVTILLSEISRANLDFDL